MNDNEDAQEQTQSSHRKDGVSRARHEIIDLIAKRIVKIAEDKAEKPLADLCKKLPSNSNDIRNLPFFNPTLEAIMYQRDNYFIGTSYAGQRQSQRQGQFPLLISPAEMKYDATALGSIQTIKLGSWFIPSSTVKIATIPLVVSLPSGVLREPILNATVNAIPLAQTSLNQVVKDSMLQVMKNPYWRDLIKSRTNTYMSNRDD